MQNIEIEMYPTYSENYGDNINRLADNKCVLCHGIWANHSQNSVNKAISA